MGLKHNFTTPDEIYSLIRKHEEQRPKNAGVHTDQNKKLHTKSNRRKAKRELRNHDHD